MAGGINLFAYVGGDPVNWSDPWGLVRWGDVFNSSMGLIGNGLGVLVGSALISVPEPTMMTKVVGYATLTKSATGWGLNWYNFVRAVIDDCPEFDAPSSATRLIATVVSPGSNNALLAADVVDLSIDLMSGRGKIRTNTYDLTITRPYDPITANLVHPNAWTIFIGTQITQTVLQDTETLKENLK